MTGGPQPTVEGSASQPFIAIITDPDPSATASQYTASINWGDGSPAIDGTIAPTNTGLPGQGPPPPNAVRFAITASHAYLDSGSYFISIAVQDTDTLQNRGGVGFTAQIQEAPIALRGITDALVNPYCDAVALIDDSNPLAFAGDYTSTIDWGDGASGAGSVVSNSGGGPGTGQFAVQGCHTYADLGPHTVTTTVVDSDLIVTAQSTAWTYAATLGGTFVIGDQNAAVGASVTFWGAAWSSQNVLSDGAAPDAFKGFAPNRSPICVGSWSAKPGDSSSPSASVPSYTAVVVSSDVTKQGPDIEGNSIHVALVRTDAGYGPTPDQPGMGAVVFMIC